ncbi:MAG: hypothetical protein ACD_80C00131G0031 [uncultured bacterium (gcode 4)]|uniref:Fibronectin type-III domain-containing protein n=1 Tax=uncultured bacterium (gcode 4) TaxID=1234023 RepID=K1XXB5_9BACT|nr:MAG: hypothetical protein ACD_80C00131G0031 [uncultured bacterium (gcode 4)]
MNFSRKALTASIAAISMLAIGFLAQNTVYAADPDAFIVEVIPSSFDVNQTVDITIKAVKANGDIVKEYQWDVFIEVEGIVDTADYTVPSDGLYTFLPQDQGVRLFSKGLTIKKAGTFTIKVSDIINDTIIGQKTIIVGTTTHGTTAEPITLISPVPGGIEKNSIVNVMAISPTLPNAPYDIYINNNSVSQGMTNANGDISAYVSGITEWDNILQIKILNANNEVIGESQIISFTYQPIKDGVFNSIKIQPTGTIKQWEKVTFTVSTSDSVTSTQLKLSDGKSIPMDKQSAWVFTKQVLIDTQGTLQVGVDLIVLGQTRSYTGVATLVVEAGIAIGKIRLYSDSIDKSKLNVTRETIGTSPQYKIDYGTSQNNLNLTTTVQTNEIIINNLNIGDTYFFQITPVDNSGNPLGTPSEITQAKIWSDVSCTVVGITVTGQQIGEKYYLVRKGINNIDKYVVYRSDFETSDITTMQKVGETTGTMFEYPFNKLSKNTKYAYYLIEGICKDGTTLKIDNVKKIVVGPAENILLIILISMFGYTIYKLYGYSKT